MTLRFPRIRDIALDTKVYDDGHKVQAVASWNGLRSVWCRISETDDPLPSGEVAQCQRLAIRMLRILAWTRCAPAARMVDQAKKRAARARHARLSSASLAEEALGNLSSFASVKSFTSQASNKY